LYNETKRKIYIKNEKDTSYFNVAFETMVDVDMMHMFAAFDNFDLLMQLVPIVYNVRPEYKATDAKCIMKAMIDFPWPLSDTEAILHVSGVIDYTNKGILLMKK
jgi:hypothetical protein